MDNMADEYQMLDELGSGSFGVVYRAIERSTGEYVAIKHIDLEGSDDDIREIQQEISLLATCSSDFVTRYKTSFVRGVKLWIVMEYLGGGSCLDLLRPGPIPEGYIAVIVRELLRGLDYLHSTGKIHRDIKAANILLSETGHVKIADFGVAAQLTNIKSQRLTFVGTPFWMAPEVIQEAGYDFHADIWSLGITAMELALGAPPRSDVHPMKVLFLIPKEKPPRLEGAKFSRDFKEFVAQCLNKDPDKRPTARALLKHPFIKRAGNTDMLQDLVSKVRRYKQKEESIHPEDPRYYEETLRQLRAQADDHEDEWIFDTLKPNRGSQPVHTVKKRKLEYVGNEDVGPSVTAATAALEELSVEDAPLKETVNSPARALSERTVSTIRTPQAQFAGTHRKVSAIAGNSGSLAPSTTRRRHREEPVMSPGACSMVRSSQRQPLGIDVTFGNSPSTIRQFRRVSSTSQCADHSPTDSVFDSDGENKAPRSDTDRRPRSKDAVLGHRCFERCVDPALQAAHAATADASKRAALGRLGEAWAALNDVDGEGELLMLKAILERVQADPKLASVLLPQRVVQVQLASLRAQSMKRKPMDDGWDPQARTVSGRPRPEAPGRLVLNPQNPHLKKMKSRQGLEDDRDEGMPGRAPEVGMEHVGMLSNVLYGKWAEGLTARWPAS